MDDVERAMVSAYRLGVSVEDFCYLTGYSVKTANQLCTYFKESPDLEGDLDKDSIADILKTYKTLLACYVAGLDAAGTQEYLALEIDEINDFWDSAFKKTRYEDKRNQHLLMRLNPLLVLASYQLVNVDITDHQCDVIRLGNNATAQLWEIIEFYKEGLTFYEIANMFGCPQKYIATIGQLLKQLDIKKKDRVMHQYYQRIYRAIAGQTGLSVGEAENLLEDIKERYVDGVRSGKVAEELGVPVDTVSYCYRVCVKLGLLEKKIEQKEFTDSENETIKKLYEQGFSATEVSSQINKPIAKVNKEFCRLKETESYQIREKYILDSNLKVYELFIKGFKKSEIASILDISVNQVTNRLSWVRKNVSVEVLTEMSKYKEKRHKNKNGEI